LYCQYFVFEARLHM